MPKNRPLTLKQRVRLWLVTHEMNQGQLAGRIGIQESRLSRILSGKETASLAEAVAIEDLTGIPARDFAEVA